VTSHGKSCSMLGQHLQNRGMNGSLTPQGGEIPPTNSTMPLFATLITLGRRAACLTSSLTEHILTSQCSDQAHQHQIIWEQENSPDHNEPIPPPHLFMPNTPSRPPPTSRSTTSAVRKLISGRNKTTGQAQDSHLSILPPQLNSLVPHRPTPLTRRRLPSYQATVHRGAQRTPPSWNNSALRTQRTQHSLPNTRPPNFPPMRLCQRPNTPPTRPRLKHTSSLPSHPTHPPTPTLNQAPPPLHQSLPPRLDQHTLPYTPKSQWDSSQKDPPWEWRT